MCQDHVIIVIVIIIIIIIIIIQLNRYLLTCRLNSKSAYYKASTKTTKNSTNTQNKQTNKRKQYYSKRYIKVLGQTPIYSEETQVSLFKNVPVQRKISFQEVTGFLKISTSLHTRLAAVTHPAVGEFLHVAVNRAEILTLREGTRIPVVSKRDGQHFKPE
jgi:hypothetical protein